jgi:glyoxylase-like metal-dependent hydrolase (beta-lactamase superfamily II)
MAAGTQVAEGVHRLGSRLFNYYLVEDGEALTLVDAGLPGLRPSLDGTLAALGRSLGDIRAVVLTHAHGDHIGIAEAVRTEAGVPVHVHANDEELARTGRQPKREGSLLPYLRHGAAWGLILGFMRNGRPPKIGEVTTFGDGDVLDVPGRPVAIPTPGHTEGHVSFHLPDRGVLFTGDAMNSRNPMTGRLGPQIMPRGFNISSARALESLSNLENLDADAVLFGHGDPWADGPAAAVARARELGPS